MIDLVAFARAHHDAASDMIDVFQRHDLPPEEAEHLMFYLIGLSKGRRQVAAANEVDFGFLVLAWAFAAEHGDDVAA